MAVLATERPSEDLSESYWLSVWDDLTGSASSVHSFPSPSGEPIEAVGIAPATHHILAGDGSGNIHVLTSNGEFGEDNCPGSKGSGGIVLPGEGGRVVVCGQNIVETWNYLSGDLEKEVISEIDFVLSSDTHLTERVGSSLHAPDFDGTFEFESDRVLQTVPDSPFIESKEYIATSFARNELLACCSPGGLSRRRLPSLDLVEQIIFHAAAMSAEFIPGTLDAVSFGLDDEIRRWNLPSGEALSAEAVGATSDVAIGPGGSFMWIRRYNGGIICRNLVTGVESHGDNPPGNPGCKAVNKQGSIGHGYSSGGYMAWDFGEPSEALTIGSGHRVEGMSDYESVVFVFGDGGELHALSVPDGQVLGGIGGRTFLVSTGISRCLVALGDEVQLWNFVDGEIELSQQFDGAGMLSGAYSQEARRAAFLSDEGRIYFWDLGDGFQQGPVVRGDPTSIAINDAGDQALTTGDDGSIRLFQLPPVPALDQRRIDPS